MVLSPHPKDLHQHHIGCAEMHRRVWGKRWSRMGQRQAYLICHDKNQNLLAFKSVGMYQKRPFRRMEMNLGVPRLRLVFTSHIFMGHTTNLTIAP